MHVTNNYLTRGVNRALCKAICHVAEGRTQAEVSVKKERRNSGAARRRQRAVTRVCRRDARCS